MPPQQTQIPPQSSSGSRSYLATALLSGFLGVLGLDRFYLGYTLVGAIKLLTFGFLGIGALLDFILVLTGSIKAADGTSVRDFPDYKKYHKPVVIFFLLFLVLQIVLWWLNISLLNNNAN